MIGTTGSVRSVNVAAICTVEINGEAVTTGIYKTPSTGRVELHGINLAGDDQADREAHGGPDRVIYAYSGEDYDWWAQRLGRELTPGTFGDNLTLDGINVSGAKIGERWRVGTTLLQVTSPRVPCSKLAHVMNDIHFVREFAQALRPGAYLRVLEEGDIGVGDAAEVLEPRPQHDLSIAEMTRIYLFDRPHARAMLVAPELPDSWRTWALEHGD